MIEKPAFTQKNTNTNLPDYVFLFGAGAEAAGQLGITSGTDFRTDILTRTEIGVMANKIMNQAGKGKYQINTRSIIVPSSDSILYQTMQEAPDYTDLFRNEKDRKIAEDYLKFRTGSSKYAKRENDISQKFRKLYYNQFYKPIKQNRIKSEEVKYFLKHLRFFSFVDSLFNYMRMPEKYSGETANVMKVYYAAYLSILDSLYQQLAQAGNLSQEIEERYQQITKEPVLEDARKKLVQLVQDLQESIIEQAEKTERQDLYYYKMRELNQVAPIGCITTNYTYLGERLSGVENAYMAYLHGRLEMFEDVIYKDIRSITEFGSEDIIFPYMLIPSGIKPLISPRQIGEYQKAMELVRQAKKVFIIGYGINSDDEHITNLLRWKLSECEGEVYYFIYRDFKQTSTSIKKLFKNTDRLKFFHTTDFHVIIDDLISAAKTKSW